MVGLLGVEMPHANISKYERGMSIPPIEIVLAYTQVAVVERELLTKL